MLGDHIHAHEGKPGDENATVECDPIELQKCFVGEQIHTNHADNKKGNDGCGNGF